MPHRMTLHIVLLGIAVLAIVACTEPANPPNFPQLSGGPVGLDAMAVGELVSENGCLRLRRIDGIDDGAGRLLIWNQTADMTADGQGVRITDESGVASSFSVGEVLQMGGGETNLDHVQKIVVQPVPSHCPGPYWLVGLEVAVYSE